MDESDTAPSGSRPTWNYWTNRSACTEDEREAAFAAYLESSVAYFEAVAAAGDKPWFDSIDQRRQLFVRRYAPRGEIA